MVRETDPSRRGFLQTTGLGLAALALGCDEQAGDDTGGDPEVCGDRTLDQTEGPYWLPDVPIRTDLDLYDEAGTRLRWRGRVVATDCTPIEGAIVDLWHANPTGTYDDSTEMRYRGQTATDAEGRFEFTTVKPGHYVVSPSWTRPAHLHVKVWVGGEELLTTQLYFETDPFNEADTIIHDTLIMAEGADGDGIVCEYELVVAA